MLIVPVTSRGLWLLRAFVLAHLAWRLGCFSWGALNLGDLPGACFEASAIASSGLVVIWLVLSETPLRRRVVRAGLFYVGLRLMLELGLIVHAWRINQREIEFERVIFRFVEDEVIVATLVFALSLRRLTGWRIRRPEPAAEPWQSPVQFRLLHLFLLTGVISLLFGLARSKWFQTLGAEGFAVHQILFLHAITIALTIVPAVIVLLPRPGWLLVLMFAVWIALPFVIAGYFAFVGWFPLEWEMVRHLATTVFGPACVAGGSALVLRACGFRLQPARPARQRNWPAVLPPFADQAAGN